MDKFSSIRPERLGSGDHCGKRIVMASAASIVGQTIRRIVMGKRAAFAAALVISWGAASAQASDTATGEASAAPLLEQKAAAYIRLREDLAFADTTPLNAAKVTRQVHERIGSHEAADVSMGQIAYAALIAADTPAFAEALEKAGRKAKNRQKFLDELRANPGMIRGLNGANEAIAAIRDVAARDAKRIGGTGDRYIADAYELQQTGWARSKLPANGSARMKEAEAYAAKREWPAMTPVPAVLSKAGIRRPNLDTDMTWTTSWAANGAETPVALDSRRQMYLTKTLVLAARYALNDLNEGHMTAFGSDKTSKRCYNMASMNLNQCISATRTSFEEAFCLGTHALNDVSRCVGWVSGAGSPKG